MSSETKLIKEIDELISKNRLEILKILEELRNTEIFKEHSTKVYKAMDVISEYAEKYPKDEEYIWELFGELCCIEYEDFKNSCNDLGIELLERSGRQSIHVIFKPKNSDDCVLDYLFGSDSSNRFIHLRLDELIEEYLQDDYEFIQTMERFGYMRAYEYDYEKGLNAFDLEDLKEILEEYSEDFNNQINNLNLAKKNLLECEEMLNEVIYNFPEQLKLYLDANLEEDLDDSLSNNLK